MAVQRRAATPAPPPIPVVEGPNFLDMGFYSGGFTLPPGKYCMAELTVKMFKGDKDKSQTPARLGVMITFVPLSDPREENKREQFYSLGSKADQSYAPNPVTGKGIIPIPGAPAAGLNNSTNWYLLLKSLYDGGLPQGLITNDLTPLEGAWVDMGLIDEPAERAGFQSNTAEVGSEPRVARKIAVAVEVLAGPWDASNPGGWPTEPVVFDDSAHAPAPVAHTKVNGAPTPAARPVAVRPALAPPAEDTSDIQMAAINGVSDVLEKNANGLLRIQLRTQTFDAVKTKLGEDMAAAVIATFFDPTGALDTILGQVGYKVAGPKVVPQ